MFNYIVPSNSLCLSNVYRFYQKRSLRKVSSKTFLRGEWDSLMRSACV